MGDIYAIIRKDQNKIVYIGQTIRTYKRRWQQHKQVAKYADSSRYALYAAIQKLGIDNFDPVLIEQCDNALLDEREKYWIKYYKTKVEDGGYNLTDGGDTNSNRQKKHIYRYTLSGDYIDEFDSIADAAWELQVAESGISKAASGTLNQSHGYR
jgi:group I intron endonuclease